MIIYATDFENTVPKNQEVISTRVWGCGLCPIGTEFVSLYNDLDTYFQALDGMDNIVYSHNLAYDGKLILDYLYTHGYSYNPVPRLKKKSFSHLITENGQFYFIKVKLQSGTQITFRDSLKILPFKLDKIAEDLKLPRKLKGDIDYTKDRPDGYIMDEEDRAYLTRDIIILSKALDFISQYGLLDNLTIGKSCFQQYKQTVKQYFDTWFPVLDSDTDAYIRKSYKGGWCYLNPKYQDLILSNVFQYDVNSLYPYEMRTKAFPYGQGIKITDWEDLQSYNNHAWFVRIKVSFHLKDRCFPWIQTAHDIYSVEDKLVSTSDPIELTLTKMDLRLLFDTYNIDYFEFLDAIVFEMKTGMFNTYIDKWFGNKVKSNDNPTLRLVSKLMLNNLGGQFGKSPVGSIKTTSYTNQLQFTNVDSSKESVYIPVAAYMTSYARCKTIRTAIANYDDFVYADTDSIKSISPITDIEIDSVKLGAWKDEGTADTARFVKPKTYIYVKDNKVTVKASGATDTVINVIKSMANPIQSFTFGLTVHGGLKSKVVSGGVILIPVDFNII